MNEIDFRLKALDEARYLLERMLNLAEYSASDSCNDEQRKKLQTGLVLLRKLFNETIQRYEREGTLQ